MGVETALIAASTALTAAGSISAGNQASAAAKFEAQQAREQAELAKLQALDEEVRRRRDLQETLSRQRARAAAAGQDTQSGSVFALTEASISDAEKDLKSILIQGNANKRRFDLSAQQSSLEASASRTKGYLGAASSLFSGGLRISQIPSKKTKEPTSG